MTGQEGLEPQGTLFGTKAPRDYRALFKGENLVFFHVCIFETDLTIGTCRDLQAEAFKLASGYREQVEAYIRLYPEFLTSLVPFPVQPGASPIIEKMCKAGESAGVGPMAAVAGAIAEMVGYGLSRFSPNVIVENGGDIFIKTQTVRKVGIYAGNSPLSGKLALEVSPQDTPAGICTSSGTVGHSLSFGRADAAVVVSGDTFLADAAATALGNRIQTSEDIGKALEFVSGIPGVCGAVVIIGDKMGAWGGVKLVRL